MSHNKEAETDHQLFTDLVLADFLVSCTPFVGEVVFQ